MGTPANTLIEGCWSMHRSVSGAPVTADAALSGTNPPVSPHGGRLGPLFVRGYETVMLGVQLDGGTTPTVDVEVYSYDVDRDTFFLLHTASGVKPQGTFVVTAHGHQLYARLAAVSGNPTLARVFVSPGAPSAASC